MRSDLTKACVSCAWRVSSVNEDCPRCGSLLVPPQVALDALSDQKALSTKVGRPIRDALFYGSSAAFSSVAIVGGVVLALSTVLAEGAQESSGMAAILLFMGLFGFTAAFAIIFGFAWAILAGPILLFSWLTRRGQPKRLRVAAFAESGGVGHEPPKGNWLDTTNAWLGARKKRLIASVVLVIGVGEIGAELLADEPYFLHHSLLDSVKLLGLAGLCQLIAFAFLSVPSVFALQWALWSFDKLRRVRHLLRERKSEHLANDLTTHRPELESDRGHAEGRVVHGDAPPLIAPLSGAECLGFRIVGRVGSVLLDDANLASDIAVEAERDRVVLRAERAIVALPEPSERTRQLTSEQQKRVTSLFARLGLPMSDDLELGESLLREGNRVNAFGAEGSEAARAEGYRSAVQQKLLSDADGLPLLLVK